MKIQFVPQYEFSEKAVHINSTLFEGQYPGISRWDFKEIKDIPEDLSFRANYGGSIYQVKLTDDILSSPSYVVVKSKGKAANPNFTCSVCGEPALTEYVLHPKDGTTPIPVEIDGKRVCIACFDKAEKKLTPTGYDFLPKDENDA
jgi:hypothetical protein